MIAFSCFIRRAYFFFGTILFFFVIILGGVAGVVAGVALFFAGFVGGWRRIGFHTGNIIRAFGCFTFGAVLGGVFDETYPVSA